MLKSAEPQCQDIVLELSCSLKVGNQQVETPKTRPYTSHNATHEHLFVRPVRRRVQGGAKVSDKPEHITRFIFCRLFEPSPRLSNQQRVAACCFVFLHFLYFNMQSVGVAALELLDISDEVIKCD